MLFFIVVYIKNLDQGCWKRVAHIVNQVGDDDITKNYLDTDAKRSFTLIVIRKIHHCIIHIILYEVRPKRGGIEIFT